jgi:5'-deoxynucleotidase YfbR-like HD superfamily hydrolase
MSFENKNSRVVLIGISEFPQDESLNSLPSVKNNIRDMQKILANCDMLGIHNNNIITITDEPSYVKPIERLIKVAEEAEDTLLVYYAGHGIVGSQQGIEGQLLLAFGDTTNTGSAINAINISNFCIPIINSRARNKILILDCCFSGRAIPQSNIFESVNRNNICIIVSSSQNEPSRAPVNETYTAFTGALIQTLQDGIDEEKSHITLQDLYDNIQIILSKRGIPNPQIANFQDAHRLKLSLNPKYYIKPSSVTTETLEFISRLEKVEIPILFRDPIKIVSTLKKLPRIGKFVRIKKDGLDLQSRSVYDHIESMAHTADMLRMIVKECNFNKTDIAKCIIFHDLGEILVGDYPKYTALDKVRDEANPQLIPLDEGLPFSKYRDRKLIEKTAAEFISLWLDDQMQADFKGAQTLLQRTGNKTIGKFILMIDKIDPIIAIYRYIHFYCKNGDLCIDNFLVVMKDFFANPSVAESINRFDSRIVKLVQELQNRENARNYCSDPDHLKKIAIDCNINYKVLRSLIEGRKLLFIENTTENK